jgi:hypothetical protein
MTIRFLSIASVLTTGLAMMSLATALAQQPDVTRREIEHLLDYVAQPGCQFNRNGSWYQGAEARDHLRQKYEYLDKRKMVPDAESFIQRAASESSMSGKPYQVRCGAGAPTPSGPWLREELKRYRAVNQAKSSSK